MFNALMYASMSQAELIAWYADREQIALDLRKAGRSFRAIADELGVHPSTARKVYLQARARQRYERKARKAQS